MPDGGNVPEDLAKRLIALQEEFRPKLRKRLELLRDFTHQMVDGSASPEDAESAKQIAHRVRGTAGSYGFHRAGEIAQSIEAALASPSTSADQWNRCGEELEHAIAHDCQAQGEAPR